MGTNSVYNQDGKLISNYKDLPHGYFYKGKFFKSVNSVFAALKKDEIVGITHYTNGTWRFRRTTYKSLQEIYDNNPDEFENVSFDTLRRNWVFYNIQHDNRPCVKYWLTSDDHMFLYNDKEWVILDLMYELCNCQFLANEEIVEEEYFDSLTEEEIVSYCKKSIEERIAILESWLIQ